MYLIATDSRTLCGTVFRRFEKSNLGAEVRPQQTRELDIANYEDIVYLASLWSKHDLTNAQIRQSSNIMRRLLHYKEIQGSTAPRSLRLMLNSPDNKALVRAANNGHLDFFQSGGTTVLGIWFRASTVSRNAPKVEEALADFNPDAVIQLKLDSFLDQPVFFVHNVLVSRRTVLLYVANKAAGTHFDAERQSDFWVLDRVRSAVTMKLVGEAVSFGFNTDAFHTVATDFVPSGHGIDPVFIELAASIRYFTESDSVQNLLALLKSDLNL
jgi:hypothetical protein